MALVPDQKFSTFVVGGELVVGDIIVGLRGGLNTQFSWSGELPPGVVVPISQGGTGATTAAGARTNLGLGSMAIQNANAVDITGGTAALASGSVVASPIAGIDIANKTYVDAQVAGSVTSGKGTANQVLINGVTTVQTGALVFTLPQDIGTTSSPTFASLTLTSPLTGANGGTGIANTGLTINLGTATTGFLLTSDSSGNATWQAPGYLTGSVLLNPSADQTILNAHNLIMASGSMVAPTILPGNLSLTGNTISSTNSNGNINIIPNGTGVSIFGGTNNFASGTNGQAGVLSIGTNSLNGAFSAGSFGTLSGGNFNGFRSRSTTPGSHTIVQNSDVLTRLQCFADDGTQFLRVGIMEWVVGAVPSVGVIPTTWLLQTVNSVGSTIQPISTDVNGVLSLSSPLPAASGGTGINSLGTGVATALGVNVGTAGAFVVNGSVLGTPSSGTLTNCSGLPISGIASLGTGVATALGQNVTGSGAIVLANAPTFVTGTVTAPSITFSSTSGIIGTITNDNAASGSVGEYISATNSTGTSLTSLSISDIEMIILGAGDWDVEANIEFSPVTSPVVMFVSAWINTTSATDPNDYTELFLQGTLGVYGTQQPLFKKRLSLASTTTVYLSATSDFTGAGASIKCYGIIAARRIR